MILTVENLRAGINNWLSRPSWPKDFSASLYSQLERDRQSGLTEEWWHSIVDLLAKWRATRGETKAEIFNRGRPRLPEMESALATIRASLEGREPHLELLQWQMLEPLFEIANSIKGSSTPVFGSKLCHFILPDAFPVIDWAFTGVRWKSYEQYWTLLQREWTSSEHREALLRELAAHVPPAHRSAFPWATKITELCVAAMKSTAPASETPSRPAKTPQLRRAGDSAAQDRIEAAMERAGRELQEQYGEESVPTREIVSMTARYAQCSPASVLPSDFAYNIVNRGVVSRVRPMFVQTSRGYYRFVGFDYPYTGPICWKPVDGPQREVGWSEGGLVTFTDDPRV